ncbi:T9SS type A sorting domain-containing protein [Saccharicrinis sp. 156]|uniref:T9SS type A sorting domain-containing protein n=1 Tax=Saccharicrinis sp. 156 TaxID=3417574 RepID=UPI003D34F1E5
MNKRWLIVLYVIGISTLLNSQSAYHIIDGPTNLMRLNSAGNDFESVEIGSESQSYTFCHSVWDIENPWSVVSEQGINIYTKLDLGKVSDIDAVYLISPDLELNTSETYNFNQHVFGIDNETFMPSGYAKLQLKLVEGSAKDFHPDLLQDNLGIGNKIYSNTTDSELVVDNIVPQSNGTHYFVIGVTYFSVNQGNTKGMSLGFKNNTVSKDSDIGVFTTEEKEFNVFPNPAKNNLRINNYIGDLEILDVLGNAVSQIPGYHGQIIDISYLSNGVYLLGMDGNYIRFIKI